jgi:type IV pilus assembly protein PilC
MKFNYQARTKDGDVQAGDIEAASEEAASRLLQEYGLILTYLKRAETPFYQRRLPFLERVGRKEIVFFSRQLAVMFKSEVSLVEALRVLAEETKSINFREKILKIGESVEGGSPLSEALEEFPDLFSQFYVNLVRSGEASGKLSEVLEYLANHLEREYALLQKTTVMMIYPLFVLVTFIAVFIVMAVVVMPKLTDVLAADQQNLPFLTKAVISITGLTRTLFLPLLLLLVAGFFFGRRFLNSPVGREKFDDLILKLPLAGEILKLIYLTRFAENLSTLVSGGLNIAKSLEITAGVVGNRIYKNVILETKESVRRGEAISKTLKRYPKEIPAFFSQMVLVGERTGRLAEALLNTVAFYQQEIERGIQALLSLIEPVMIIFLALLVGTLIAAVLLPLYQMGGGPGF